MNGGAPLDERREKGRETEPGAVSPPSGDPLTTHRRLRRLACIAWVSPNTCLALSLVPLVVATGGGFQYVEGAVEIYGGAVEWMLRWLVPLPHGASAMTLGHAILGRNRDVLQRCRLHEQVHVRQYERWGPLFLPAYFGASLWQWVRGGCPYRDNPFEKEAYSHSDPWCVPSGDDDDPRVDAARHSD